MAFSRLCCVCLVLWPRLLPRISCSRNPPLLLGMPCPYWRTWSQRPETMPRVSVAAGRVANPVRSWLGRRKHGRTAGGEGVARHHRGKWYQFETNYRAQGVRGELAGGGPDRLAGRGDRRKASLSMPPGPRGRQGTHLRARCKPGRRNHGPAATLPLARTAGLRLVGCHLLPGDWALTWSEHRQCELYPRKSGSNRRASMPSRGLCGRKKRGRSHFVAGGITVAGTGWPSRSGVHRRGRIPSSWANGPRRTHTSRQVSMSALRRCLQHLRSD